MARERKQVKAANVDGTGLSAKARDTLTMLTALEDEDGLSDWQKDFVASVSDWFLIQQRELTQKQFECLESVYKKYN